MGRKKTSVESQPLATADDFARDEPLHTPPVAAAEKPRTIDMVRAAIAAGFATAKFGVPWIKENYGVDMNSGNFSVTKSSIERGNKKAAGAKATTKRSYTPRQAKPAVVEAAPAASHNGNGMSPSDAARSVKELVERLGATEVRNLVDLFGG